MKCRPLVAQAHLIMIVLIAQFLLLVESTAGQNHDATQDGDVSAVQRPCTTVADLEEMNRGGIRHLFTLRGIDAKIFLALDPRLLKYPELLELLMEQDVDEIVAWKLVQRYSLGAAVPFSGGCAVDGYGEPDMIDKIKLMKDVVKLIKRHGPDDRRVRSRMDGLWGYEPPLRQNELGAEVDAVLARVRSLVAAET